eukprot:17287-Heterococcus_DN1.PRE.1
MSSLRRASNDPFEPSAQMFNIESSLPVRSKSELVGSSISDVASVRYHRQRSVQSKECSGLRGGLLIAIAMAWQHRAGNRCTSQLRHGSGLGAE